MVDEAAKLPNIFEYLDYRAFLRDHFLASKKLSGAYSFRYFSRRAGLASSNFLKLVIQGKRMVAMDEATFESLLRKADLWEPSLPAPNAAGNYPALEALAVIQARDILRSRRKLGLSQVELARRAGIRPETLNRIEQGKSTPSVASVEKIDRALQAAEATVQPQPPSEGPGLAPATLRHD